MIISTIYTGSQYYFQFFMINLFHLKKNYYKKYMKIPTNIGELQKLLEPIDFTTTSKHILILNQ